MTEQEWMECKEPDYMLLFLFGGSLNGGADRLAAEKKVGTRRLRLFACSCCRRIWQLLTENVSRQVIEVAERYVDGFATEAEFIAASDDAESITDNFVSSEYYAQRAAAWVGKPHGREFKEEDVCEFAVRAASCNVRGLREIDSPLRFDPNIENPEYEHHSNNLRCIFGNPFNPVTLNPSWLTPTVKALAAEIYSEMAFDRMPVLGDALEESGCDVKEVLEHCRNCGEHVRGCHVVDKVLGKE